MPAPLAVAVVYNQPVLAADDPDAASEAGVLEAVEAIAAALERRGHQVRQLGIGPSIDEILDALRSNLAVDVVVNLFEGLGGTGAAEGPITGLIELCGAPLTGSPSQCLALVQDKARTKWLLAGAGLPTAAFFQFGPEELLPRERLEAALRDGPYIVKPAREDASLGIGPESVVENFSQLERQVADLRARYGDVLVERFIVGREVNVGVVDFGDGPRTLPLAEIVFEPGATGRWDLLTYDAKWKPESAACVRTPVECPARIEPQLAARIEQVALAAFRVTGCRDYARVDLRVDVHGEPYILEVNGNPDLSPSAGFARALGVAGCGYDDFVERLVTTAARRRGLVERPCPQHP